MNTTNDRIIIGIDPGTNVMGYGVLRIVGNTPELMTLGVIQLNKFESHYLRLRRIFERVLGLIEQYLPDEMAIEAPFFGKNVKTVHVVLSDTHKSMINIQIKNNSMNSTAKAYNSCKPHSTETM